MREAPISPEQWQPFCESFAREHHGWLATLGVTETSRLSRNRYAIRALARNAALTDVRLNRSEAGGELIVVTGEGAARSVYRVDRPVALYVEEEDEGRHRGLRVDGAEGRSLLIEFGATALPENLNGISDSEI